MSVTYRTEHGEVTYSMQDMEDGRALRRLREALPAGWYLAVLDGPDGHWIVELQRPDDDDGVTFVNSERAPTIAEAADKCREAIGRALEGSG